MNMKVIAVAGAAVLVVLVTLTAAAYRGPSLPSHSHTPQRLPERQP